MGVYCFAPRGRALIPPGERLDFPDLVLRLIAAGETVRAWPSQDHWLDIGRHDDYEQAQDEFNQLRHLFLPDAQHRAEVKVLLLDEGRELASVAAARALVARGWEVGSGSATPSLSSRSSATTAWHRIVHTDDGEDAFADSVQEVVSAHRYDAVLPGWESAVVALSARRERLSFPLGYGPHEGILTAIDKWNLRPPARAAGLQVPRTVIATADGLEQLGGAVVVKPASPCIASLGAAAFDDRRGALDYARRINNQGGLAIAQERLSTAGSTR